MSVTVGYHRKSCFHKFIPSRWTLTPFQHWKEMARPDNAIIIHEGHMTCDEYTFALIPGRKLLYVHLLFEYNEMEAVLAYHLDESTKTMFIDACTANSDTFDETIVNLPSGIGGADLFERVFTSFFTSLTSLVDSFFGVDWKCELTDDCATRVAQNVFDEIANLTKHTLMNIGRMNYTIGVYDNTTEEAASSRIAAAFRGWKDRMKYRFDPHTTLGRHLAMYLFLTM